MVLDEAGLLIDRSRGIQVAPRCREVTEAHVSDAAIRQHRCAAHVVPLCCERTIQPEDRVGEIAALHGERTELALEKGGRSRRDRPHAS
ncbi:hypothetical protein [Microbacterium sp. JZ31]|uniref:hypothetical protein n=1 Tax=Microbacterium sp. JZ31 TaxID=1906274 RepID=UPI00193224B4|nr:hypothetical protein [Microbacterium sp. JZ31]